MSEPLCASVKNSDAPSITETNTEVSLVKMTSINVDAPFGESLEKTDEEEEEEEEGAGTTAECVPACLRVRLSLLLLRC